MGSKVLLTGGAGFIGSHTCVALQAGGYDVTILDDFSNAAHSVPQRIARITGQAPQVHEACITDRAALDAVFKTGRFDAVVHFAALKSVPDSVARPVAYSQINIGGLINLLEVMERYDTSALVYSSSATVYGVPEILPIPETAPLAHTNPYGFTKLVGEEMLRQKLAADPDWRIGILRYFNPAGAHASGLIGEQPKSASGNLMPVIAKVATGERPELQVFGDDYDTPDGTGVRDYIHVEDLAEGHVRSLDSLLQGGTSHTLNLGTGQGYSVLELIRTYEAVSGRAVPFAVHPRRDGDVAACYADPAAAGAALGFRAAKSLEEMCASSWQWISNGAGNHG